MRICNKSLIFLRHQNHIHIYNFKGNCQHIYINYIVFSGSIHYLYFSFFIYLNNFHTSINTLPPELMAESGQSLHGTLMWPIFKCKIGKSLPSLHSKQLIHSTNCLKLPNQLHVLSKISLSFLFEILVLHCCRVQDKLYLQRQTSYSTRAYKRFTTSSSSSRASMEYWNFREEMGGNSVNLVV